ncbi:putative metalloprotease CJM1_0395 family protein [Fibrobacterota bacterium]
MLSQVIASVFSSQGVLPVQRYRPVNAQPQDKNPVSTQINQESAIVEFSPEVKKLLALEKEPGNPEENKNQNTKGKGSQNELSEEEKRDVEELKKTDRDVKAHEQAHVSAGGQYVNGGPTYEFQQGPDGKQYAVGGHVNIDSSPVADDPQATVQKARVVKRAALAPADPSSSDRAVASKAGQMETKARAEKTQEDGEEQAGPEGTKSLVENYGQSYTGSLGSAVNVLV